MSQGRQLRVVGVTQSLEDLPEVLTVEEAATVLRIGRSSAYELARQWRDTGGRQGLPVVVFGRSMRGRVLPCGGCSRWTATALAAQAGNEARRAARACTRCW